MASHHKNFILDHKWGSIKGTSCVGVRLFGAGPGRSAMNAVKSLNNSWLNEIIVTIFRGSLIITSLDSNTEPPSTKEDTLSELRGKRENIDA